MAKAFKAQTYGERAQAHHHTLVRTLFGIMEEKKTNLSLAADINTKAELLEIADKVGPYICVLKTHIDVIADFDQDLVDRLVALSKKHNFLIFEDRKFADIGNTVKLQYGGGVYKIASWAHITNCHIIPGEGIISGLKEVGKPLDRGLLLLAEMSSKGSLAVGSYTDKNVELAKKHKDFVFGFIGSRTFSDEEHDFVTMTPGVNLVSGNDSLGQQFRTPEHIICENGSDIIIVGRGIYAQEGVQPEELAEKYRKAGWDAYLKRIQ
ncbi:orotidine 5'-phosphate decarboxylase [Mycoemilia scoparia]|uniref:Orotidine 5'-phosphate decarboxylase n=1 Tax=Mycoemilia scoparia TaxID=417184 RepID=A0A9W8A560_9FUNG|nr:orotidine 5'-phosphate decarboxylase [Mycoemilia scoparia]